ncbi:uncharacterized protein PGTG_21843 [Puccinia graminis f. sp. tritici CRL 75-36-700-3]|uniref:Uncharacterized protein n=1 Tax=Puccinia graminis f. sp. tritici (strain CRL 75-36-700-3 / race SCCL) TaxID=418459 RepID=H6QSK0_PUCGT|nr:uncharacterized protein PGTG_21843 [Puccinia graminis f. sp. tritici CRL 75-36-700-3]EHS63751.1 hypothetical protein PGTG_21843 [Puccinia graminis f. sp. tritici CRL 75-36-700-3]
MAANQILSGARLLSFGKFYLNISNLVALLGERSPLYSRDVLNCDKQDNGRAYQTMNWETLEASLQSPQHTGLAIDFTTIDRDGISSQSYEIFHFLGNSLIGLIIAQREFHPTVPFLPWKHGTEACEHIFGWMRVIMPNFMVLNAQQMLPKVFAIVRNVMSGKMKVPQSEHLQSGYNMYNFTNKLVAESYEKLAQFTTNMEIAHKLLVAESQAWKIAAFAGIDPDFCVSISGSTN